MLGHGRIVTGLFPNQLRRQVFAGNLNYLTNPLPGGINPAWSHVTSRLTRWGFSRQVSAWMDDGDSFFASEGSGSPKGLVGDTYTPESFGFGSFVQDWWGRIPSQHGGPPLQRPSGFYLSASGNIQLLQPCILSILQLFVYVNTTHSIFQNLLVCIDCSWAHYGVLLMCRWVHIVGLLPLTDKCVVSSMHRYVPLPMINDFLLFAKGLHSKIGLASTFGQRSVSWRSLFYVSQVLQLFQILGYDLQSATSCRDLYFI